MKEKPYMVVFSVLLVIVLGVMTVIIGVNKVREEKIQKESSLDQSSALPTLTLSVDADEEGEELEKVSEPALDEKPRIEFLGMVTFKTGEKFEKTEIGGLSALAYDAEQDVYYVLSDDRGRPDDARFYTVQIAPDGSAVTFQEVTFLVDEEGKTVKAGTYDTEGIAFIDDTLFISSEGDAGLLPSMDPGISVFTLSGERTGQFTIPKKFLPDGFGRTGIRENKAFEPLAISPDGQTLTTAVENALVLDGPIASYEDESFSRLLQLDTTTGLPTAEFVYVTGMIPVPNSSSSGDNGLVELIALDNEGSYLALERSYVSGFGNTIQLYHTSIDEATDVSSMNVLWDADANVPLEFTPMKKTRITKLVDLGIDPDNVEGMALGPLLDDGRQALVLVSDNNFNDSQETQFIVLAIDLD